eukprot:COSAG02_NODE_619_length_19446_cov_9.557141_23_plen_211_part_00
MPTCAAAPSASASPIASSASVVILATLLVPLACADLVEPTRVAVAFDEASYASTAVAMAWAAAVAVLSKVVMRLKEEGGVPTEEELNEAEGAVAQVADSARAPTGRLDGGGVGETTGGPAGLNGLFGRAKGAQGQDRVPVKEREPRVATAYLAGLKRIAACTQGDDTAAQALEAAEELLQSAIAAADQDLQMVRDAYAVRPDFEYVFDED